MGEKGMQNGGRRSRWHHALRHDDGKRLQMLPDTDAGRTSSETVDTASLRAKLTDLTVSYARKLPGSRRGAARR